MTSSVVVGGTGGLGREVAQRFADRGDAVIITGRDRARADAIAAEIGGDTQALAVDLRSPKTIADAFGDVTAVDNLVITAIQQHAINIADFDIQAAIDVVTVKLVGYIETVRVLSDRFRPQASAVLFGGLANVLPYPGSTMVTTFNSGLGGVMRTLAREIAPYRVNVVHPGVVGDSPKWRDMPNHPHVPRTPIGRLVTMAEIVDATEFLLRNSGVNAHELFVDGGVRIS